MRRKEEPGVTSFFKCLKTCMTLHASRSGAWLQMRRDKADTDNFTDTPTSLFATPLYVYIGQLEHWIIYFKFQKSRSQQKPCKMPGVGNY